MNNLPVFQAYPIENPEQGRKHLCLVPQNETAVALVTKVREAPVFDNPLHVVVFETTAEAAHASEAPLNTELKPLAEALKTGFGAAFKAFMSPPIDSAEAERRLLVRWTALYQQDVDKLPTMVAPTPVDEYRDGLRSKSGLLGALDSHTALAVDYPDDENINQQLDVLAALWLLRRARDQEEARRHAALVLESVTAAAGGAS